MGKLYVHDTIFDSKVYEQRDTILKSDNLNLNLNAISPDERSTLRENYHRYNLAKSEITTNFAHCY